MDSDINTQKQDMVTILRFSSKYEMSTSANAKKLREYLLSNNKMTSSIGQQYLSRLKMIEEGSDLNKTQCLFCRTNISDDGVLCRDCMKRYSGGALSLKRDSLPVDVSPSVPAPTRPSALNLSAAVQDNPKTSENQVQSHANDDANIASRTIEIFANKVDKLAGGEGKAELKVRELFSDVFKHHTSEEAERIFICGTASTTPDIKDIESNWPAPWLYSRVALWLLLTFVILEITWDLTANTNLLPGMMFVGSCIVPLSTVIFFFETNVPQNISIFRVVQIFFLGGVASLLSTLIIFMIFPVGELSYVGAVLVGIIEEVGKMIIVALFISRMWDCKYVLNGLLIGGAVGAGFAVFESAGYAFRILLLNGYDAMVENINLRAIMSPGGHVAWSAITGAAIMLALKGEKFEWDVLKSGKFLGLFIIPIILHSIWDMPIGLEIIYPILILAAWITLLVLIQNGLKEITQINKQ